jgi:hypothetical protein
MREHISRQKKTTTGFSIPSLKHPTPGFGLESSATSRQAIPEIQPLHKPVTHDISRIPLRTQAKLSISQPGDIYEQEADSVAQQVMQRMAQPVNRQSIQREALPENEEELQMKPLANSITPLVQREALPEDEEELQMKSLDNRTLQREALPEDEEELQMKSLDNSTLQREALPEDEEELQMKSLDNSTLQREALPEDEEELQMKPMVQRQGEAGMAAAPDIEASINQARGGGQAIADNIREPMEVAFGADFSGVKVHTDGQSDQLNRSIQARAFTTGQDVFFRQGEYNPGSRSGQELLAHELTHVVQQNGGAVQRSVVIQRQYEEQVPQLQEELKNQWGKNEDKKEAILSAIKTIFQENTINATKDPAVAKAVLAFVNSHQKKTWIDGTKRKPPGKNDIGKLNDAENWTLRHYTDKYQWDETKNEVKPPSYKEILSALTLAAMAKENEGSTSDEKGKVGASKSGHTSKIDWDVIGNVGDTFFALFYKGQLAGTKQTFLNKAQWYAEWKIGDVSEIWASSDWLGKAKTEVETPRGVAYEGNPADVVSAFLGMMGRRGEDNSKRKIFESSYDNFEVKVHGSLKLASSSVSTEWMRVDNAPQTEEEKALKK